MSEQPNSLNNEPENKPSPEAAEPGLMDSYGSFPVWMLKIIQIATPDFLVQKNPPDKKSPEN